MPAVASSHTGLKPPASAGLVNSNVRRQRRSPAPRIRLKPSSLRGTSSACWYPCGVKVNEILRLLLQDGWSLVATKGSHRQYKHPSKPGRVTVPGKPSDDVAPGTLNSILKQAGLK